MSRTSTTNVRRCISTIAPLAAGILLLVAAALCFRASLHATIALPQTQHTIAISAAHPVRDSGSSAITLVVPVGENQLIPLHVNSPSGPVVKYWERSDTHEVSLDPFLSDSGDTTGILGAVMLVIGSTLAYAGTVRLFS